ncbi:MAG: pyridoxamine kinase [Cellulosilyticum sp.]|nr:pyridoxamine kinase [Cellulosilyticum sp.]
MNRTRLSVMLGTILNERLIREVEENVHNIVPRVAAIQDISGFGRCSLTVIMPILACMGAQVCPVPTAILSTHTGGFTNMTFTDLTDEMEAYINHWKEIGLGFDYIYTGFLGNEKQIDTVIDFCESFKRTGKECIVVDPVMGDNGKLYKTYNVVMQEKMRDLVAKADIITPNLTEAMFLLKKEYEARAFSDDEIKETLAALTDLGPDRVIITGILDSKGAKANVAYDKNKNIYWKVPYQEINVHYPGTGDAFTSVLIGSLIQGDSLPMAMSRATEFISLAIKATYGYQTETREGVMFEKVLPALFKREIDINYNQI